MSNPVSWIVLSRAHPGSNAISVVGILDPEIVKDEEAALKLLKSEMPRVESSFRLAAFGIMSRRLEHVSKRNLASALRQLGLTATNVNEVYDGVARYITRFICSVAKRRVSH